MSLFSAIPGALRPRITLFVCRFLGVVMLSQFGVAALTAADVQLTWDANPSEEAVSGYRLHYGITSGHYEYTNDVGSAHSATLENLGDDTRYFVALTAYNQNGSESGHSEEFEFKTSAAADSADGNADAGDDPEPDDGTGSPTDTTGDGSDLGTYPGGSEGDAEVEGELPSGNATAELTWQANPAADGVVGYKLYYGSASGSYPAKLDAGNSTSATITGLAESTTYFVVLTAYNEDGLESLPSEEFQFVSSTNLPPEIILTRIGGEREIETSGTTILLAVARDEDGFVARVDFYDGTRLLHSDENFPYALRVSGLGVGIHQLRAVAVDDLGDAMESETLNVQVKAAAPPPIEIPLTLALTAQAGGKIPLFAVTATPGSLVQLEASADLSNWDIVSESRADESGDVEITDPTPEDELPAQRFYRVITPE